MNAPAHVGIKLQCAFLEFLPLAIQEIDPVLYVLTVSIGQILLVKTARRRANVHKHVAFLGKHYIVIDNPLNYSCQHDICIFMEKNNLAKAQLVWQKIRENYPIGKFSKDLKISRQAVRLWKIVPFRRIEQVEKLTGISREVLRPDIYGDSKIATRAVQ
jgi:hypothetical protein